MCVPCRITHIYRTVYCTVVLYYRRVCMLSNRCTQEIFYSSARYGLVYDTNGTRAPSTLHGTERKSLPFYDRCCTCTYYVSRVLSIVRHRNTHAHVHACIHVSIVLSIVRPHMHMHIIRVNTVLRVTYHSTSQNLYHGCNILTNQIAPLEVSIFKDTS